MKPFIHIFGASGSGTSTLGAFLSRQLGFRFMDTDDYYWLPTDPFFTAKRPIPERLQLIYQDLAAADNAVLSGSIAQWGNELIPLFTLAIRLVTDTETRIKRLRQREFNRFGNRILPGGDMYEEHQDFLQWAAQYDDGDITIRSRRMHDEWQKQLQCPLLLLPGTAPLEDNTQRVLQALGRN